MTIWRYWNCFLSPVATDGMDGNGLKLEKIGQFFQVLMLRVPKIIKKFIMGSPLRWNSFDIFAVALLKHFVYDLSLKVMILARNWPKTAKSSWHCSFKYQEICIVAYFATAKSIKSRWMQQTGQSIESEKIAQKRVHGKRLTWSEHTALWL